MLSHQPSAVSLYMSNNTGTVNGNGIKSATGAGSNSNNMNSFMNSANTSSNNGNGNGVVGVGPGGTSISAPSSASTYSNFSSPTSVKEPLKQLKAKYDDPCYKVLQKAMMKHKINNKDWRNYVLVICYGDKERILGPEEKPVKVFKEMQDRGQYPSFMIRQLEEASPSSDQFEEETTGFYSNYSA